MSENNASQDNACLFCAMAEGRIKPHVVFEDSYLMAILDIAPIRRGHVQVFPRAHFTYFEDLPHNLARRVLTLGQKVAKAQKRLYGVERVAFLFTGGDIPHAHAHLVPMVEKTDVTSRQYIKEATVTFEPVPTATPQELELVASELKSALEQL